MMMVKLLGGLPTLAGTGAAFVSWIFISYLLTDQVNWLIAIFFASVFGFAYGTAAYVWQLRKRRQNSDL